MRFELGQVIGGKISCGPKPSSNVVPPLLLFMLLLQLLSVWWYNNRGLLRLEKSIGGGAGIGKI